MPWSGAPDCPVHQDRTTFNSPLSGFQGALHYNSLDCPVCHRTVQCTSGAMAICAQQSTLQSVQWISDIRAASQRGTGLSGATPDCLVPHEDKASNGRPAPTLTNRMTWRRTGHCPVRHRQQPSPTATIWLVAINTTPTGHFKGWESKQHSKSYS